MLARSIKCLDSFMNHDGAIPVLHIHLGASGSCLKLQTDLIISTLCMDLSRWRHRWTNLVWCVCWKQSTAGPVDHTRGTTGTFGLTARHTVCILYSAVGVDRLSAFVRKLTVTDDPQLDAVTNHRPCCCRL